MKLSKRQIPERWIGHFDMLNDDKRNQFYSSAIESIPSLDNEGIACDIGCGSGLLGTLLAKKSSFRKIIEFDCVPDLTKIARETIIRNNLIDKMNVWLTHTTNLDYQFMTRTFREKATCIISELLDTTFLGEGLIEVDHNHQHRLQLQHPRCTCGLHASADCFRFLWLNSTECILQLQLQVEYIRNSIKMNEYYSINKMNGDSLESPTIATEKEYCEDEVEDETAKSQSMESVIKNVKDENGQWLLEHLLLFYEIFETLQNQLNNTTADTDTNTNTTNRNKESEILQIDNNINNTNNNKIEVEVCPIAVDIYISYLHSKELWKAHCGEIGIVQGVDMSAINVLMEEIKEESLDSIRISQWNAKISHERYIGRYDYNDYINRNSNINGDSNTTTNGNDNSNVYKKRIELPIFIDNNINNVDDDDNTDGIYSSVEGFVLWCDIIINPSPITSPSSTTTSEPCNETVPEHVNDESSRIILHPLQHPECIQAVRFFDKSYKLKSQHQEEQEDGGEGCSHVRSDNEGLRGNLNNTIYYWQRR
eukprot:gene3035-5951_t